MPIQHERAYATKSNTVSSTAETISDAGWSWSAGDVSSADRALITCRTGGAMVTWSGVTPTATLGHLVAANATYEVIGNVNIANLQFIREASTDAVITVTLSKLP